MSNSLFLEEYRTIDFFDENLIDHLSDHYPLGHRLKEWAKHNLSRYERDVASVAYVISRRTPFMEINDDNNRIQ